MCRYKYGYRNNFFDEEMSKQLVESMLKNLRKVGQD